MTSIVFVDGKKSRGGGQVVLEELMRLAVGHSAVSLVMPAEGRAAIGVPSDVLQTDDLDEAIAARPGPAIVVANANAVFPSVAWSTWRAKRRGADLRSVAIVHNYPSSIPKELATRRSLARFDEAIVVEPGLLQLRPDAMTPPWLSVQADFSLPDLERTQLTGAVKSYGRPDRTKGLHLLAPMFARLEQSDWRCQVALGDALDGDRTYERRLRGELERWLCDGRRGPDWIQPGDIFVIPSIAGEAACLAAQEAAARGALVVASRIGLMPYLSPTSLSISTFPIGDWAAAAREIDHLARVSADDMAARLQAGAAEIRARAGRWYTVVDQRLAALAGKAPTDPGPAPRT